MEQTTEQKFIDSIVQSLAAMASNAIPLDKRLWGAEECAEYFRIQKRTFQEHYAPQPSFPKAIKIQRGDEGKSRPLYIAGEVIEWAIKQKK
ncbi:hypothetical protein [Nitrosomonas communis]|uniref:hypothetical protein n=1 Tax=Nitrosomonas communis TaxID=44574 RepID=UPI003D279B14